MKTSDEIRAHLEAIYEGGVNLKVCLGVGVAEERTYYLADFDVATTQSVCNTYVASVRRELANEDLSIVPLSQLDRRADVLIYYDGEEVPAELTNLTTVRDAPDPPAFSFAEHTFADVRTIILKISSADRTALFYKTSYPVALVRRDSIFLMRMSDTRLSAATEEMLRITGGFEVMLLDDGFYISDFAKFERAFNYTEIETRAALQTAQRIINTGLVVDTKGYLAQGLGPRKDIRRAASSPVFEMPAQRVLEFVAAKSAVFGLVVRDNQIQLNSHSAVKRFYQLMNDDLLTSGLTGHEYETIAKNPLD